MDYQTLTQEEKVRLVEAVKDQVDGRAITFEDFGDLVGLFCEDIAGLECLSDEDLASLISEMLVDISLLTFGSELEDAPP